MLMLGLVFLLKDRKVTISKGRRTTHFVLRDADEHEDFGFGTCSQRWPLHQRKEDNGQGARSIKRTSAVPGNCLVSDTLRHCCKWPKASECPKKTDMGTHAIPIYLPQIKRQFKRITKHPVCQLRKLQMKCQGMGASIEEILMNIGKGLKMNFFLSPTNQVGRNALCP